ncbi:5'-3' exoribonuclease 1 [Cichlidogyrus casuarinus]|uniref:5'-3' exoribonuclease 1 n=1 Tax=Cichlidogyrus casuarinus TaxID=1844966 RepID=A0ABD2Q0J2_9PLAT
MDAADDLGNSARKILGRPIRIKWPHSVTSLPVRIIFGSDVYELPDLNCEPLLPRQAAPNLIHYKLSPDDPNTMKHEWLSQPWVKDRIEFLQKQMTIRRGVCLETPPNGLIFCRQLQSWHPSTYYLRRNASSLTKTGFVGANRSAMAVEDYTLYAETLYVELLNFASPELPVILPATVASTALPLHSTDESSYLQLIDQPLPLSSLFAPGQLVISVDYAYFATLAEVTITKAFFSSLSYNSQLYILAIS